MKKIDTCGLCTIIGYYVTWAFLIFGGLVSGLSYFGFSPPAPLLEKVATYLMAGGLLLFILSYFMMRAMHHFARR